MDGDGAIERGRRSESSINRMGVCALGPAQRVSIFQNEMPPG